MQHHHPAPASIWRVFILDLFLLLLLIGDGIFPEQVHDCLGVTRRKTKNMSPTAGRHRLWNRREHSHGCGRGERLFSRAKVTIHADIHLQRSWLWGWYLAQGHLSALTSLISRLPPLRAPASDSLITCERTELWNGHNRVRYCTATPGYISTSFAVITHRGMYWMSKQCFHRLSLDLWIFTQLTRYSVAACCINWPRC